MILAVATNKGGVLKTTSVCNLAGVIYQRGGRVLIVDADNQGNTAMSFGYNPDEFEFTLYDALMNYNHADDCIYRIMGPDSVAYPDEPCIDLMPSNDNMNVFDFEILSDNENFERRFEFMRRFLRPIASDYDVVLIDTPPNMGLTVGNVLTAADGVLVPFHPERFAMRSLIKIMQAVSDFKGSYNTGLDIVGIFTTMYDSRTNLHDAIEDQAKAFAAAEGFKYFDTRIADTVAFSKAVAVDKKPLTLAKPRNRYGKSYAKLWGEITSKGGVTI